LESGFLETAGKFLETHKGPHLPDPLVITSFLPMLAEIWMGIGDDRRMFKIFHQSGVLMYMLAMLTHPEPNIRDLVVEQGWKSALYRGIVKY
jgi:hypothetical protein